MTVRVAIYGICKFLEVVAYNHMSILHGYREMEPQIFWGHDLDFLDHVTSSVTCSLDSQHMVSYK